MSKAAGDLSPINAVAVKFAVLVKLADQDATWRVVIKGDQFPDVGWPRRPGKFYVKLILDKEVKKTTGTPRGSIPVWNETFYFDANSASSLELLVYAHRKVGGDEYVGGVKESIKCLLAQEACTRKLSKHDSKGILQELQSIIEFSVVPITTLTPGAEYLMDDAVAKANEASEQMKPVSSPLEDVQYAANQVSHLTHSWEPLIEKVKLVTKVVDDLAEVHPYVKMAWTILAFTHKILLAQNEFDKSIDRLVETMNDVYAFVHEAGALKKIESQQRVVVLMAQQTTECAYFIRDYAKNKSFARRTLKNILSDIDSKIKQYEDKFKELDAVFHKRAALHTEITVLRTLDVVENLAVEADLKDMLYAKGAGYNPEKECLPKTRVAIIDEIVDWINMPDGDDLPRLFLLSGAAGTGKSSIAHTVARRFYEQKRLGSVFCFDRSNQAERRLDHVFSTTAVNLAGLDTYWKLSLWNIVKSDRSLRTTASVQWQFENFMLKPAQSLTTIGPILLVFDALDECSSPNDRRVFLTILARRVCELPSNFRVFLTSRPEPDILDALNDNRHVFCKRMDTIDKTSTTNDVTLFIQEKMSDILGDESTALSNLLAEKSEGLFQWAFTACETILSSNAVSGLDTRELYALIVSPASSYGGLNPLDRLYSVILEKAFDQSNSTVMSQFKTILGRVLAAKEPLSISALNELRCEDEPKYLANSILRSLGSLLSGVAQQSVPVQPLHISFRDFLTDADRSRSFYIDTRLHDWSLAAASLRIMKIGLRFNICGLETSTFSNRDIPDLSRRIETAVPTHLKYACQFWADHLHGAHTSNGLPSAIKDFIYNQFLHWLEVLSLIGSVALASPALLKAAKWITTNDGDPQLKAFLMDASRFVMTFKDPISQSAPHIYLSALPFAPLDTDISKHFRPQFPHTLSVEGGRAAHWSAMMYVLDGHTETVRSLACSPDGKYIASGSHDYTIRVWDAKTGNIVSGPFKGHTNWVLSVAFSPDSRRIASSSGDRTVQIGDAETGEAVSGPFTGHTDWVNCVAFSKDGRYVVSGSDDKTIRVWDTQAGSSFSGPFKGHTDTVRSIVFSPDGKHIASGSRDETVRVWDAKSGNLILEPFRGHTDWVLAVIYSPDGKSIISGSPDKTIRVWDAETGNSVSRLFTGHTDRVVSIVISLESKCFVTGSDDETIRVWDIETGNMVSRPLTGHADSVASVAISPDGKRIISGSGDRTIRVWDVGADDIVSGPFESQVQDVGQVSKLPKGHTKTVNSVAFSPDGKRIVSGSNDETIGLWDAKTGHIIPISFKGHTGKVLSVMFSPDGKRIVSGSADKTVLVWDAWTGAVVSGPLKGHTDWVNSVAFANDCDHIASGSDDKTIRVWSTKTVGAAPKQFEGHEGTVRSIMFSPDGKRIVSGSADTTILVWDTATGEIVSGPFTGHAFWVTSVAFSPDGRHIASGSMDETVRVWDTVTGVNSRVFRGHTNIVRAVAFSPSGEYIASGSRDEKIRIWGIETGNMVSGPFSGHTNWILSVNFSPDGKQIVSGSEDQTVRVWDTQTCEIGSAIATKSVRFSPDEKHALVLNNSLFHPGNDGDIRDDFRMEYGWILGPQSQLLFWVPIQYRTGLWWPRNTVVIGKHVTTLNLSQFVYGSSWQQCQA